METFFDRITFYHYPFSQPFVLLSWIFLVALSILLLAGLVMLYRKKKSSLLPAASKAALLGGLIMFIATLVSFFVSGPSSESMGWVVVPIAMLVGAITPFKIDRLEIDGLVIRKYKFALGFFSALLSLVFYLWISLLFLAIVGFTGATPFSNIHHGGLLEYLAGPAAAALRYPWMFLLYPLVFLGLFLSSALASPFGSPFKKTGSNIVP